MTATSKADSQGSIIHSMRWFFSGTLLSRFTGLLRDVTMAFAFGSHPAVAAFMMAFRFANLLRRLLGEGALNSAFIPQFEGIRIQNPQHAARFFRDLASSLGVFLILLTLVGELGLWAWLKLGNPSPGNVEVITLTAYMLPATVFICLFGLNISLLQCEKRYFIPSVAPVAFNVIWIIAAFFLRHTDVEQAMPYLSVAIVIGFFFQWAATMPLIHSILSPSLAGEMWSKIKLFSKDLSRLGKPLLLSVLGVGAAQINNALDPIFARCADAEGPAYLWYSSRMQQFPLALFGVALAGALLPPLSRAIKNSDLFKYQQFLDFALRRTISLMIPCTFAIFILGLAGVNLLYGRGSFSNGAIAESTRCLWGYGVGLLPMTLVMVFAPALYAGENYRQPMIAATVSVAVNIALSALFVFAFGWGAVSVALATSAAALCNCWMLARALQAKVGGGGVFFSSLGGTVVKAVACSLVASVVTAVLGIALFNDGSLAIFFREGNILFSRDLFPQLAHCGVLSGCFVISLWGMARLLKAEDLLAFFAWKKFLRFKVPSQE